MRVNSKTHLSMGMEFKSFPTMIYTKEILRKDSFVEEANIIGPTELILKEFTKTVSRMDKVSGKATPPIISLMRGFTKTIKNKGMEHTYGRMAEFIEDRFQTIFVMVMDK